jgi:asparagine synthase (glutamine-hydrolysing)
MLDIQQHRGPDGAGVFLADSIAMGHRRLAVIDLSDGGAQPMTSRDGRWTIVFNGEIFNYREIRIQLGLDFRTQTDTEVLLEACAHWGVERALHQSIGMFAFALWDHLEQKLVLARDRYGEKPLVYCSRNEEFAFASELKALAEFHDRRLDPAAADTYLALGYVPAPQTIFRNCKKLLAGHLLTVRPGKTPQVNRWWTPETSIIDESQTHKNSNSATHELRMLVGSAVELRLRSDVPIALCLSGGVDSSVIATECVRRGCQVEAFTIRFEEFGSKNVHANSDEWHASTVAQHLGIRHEVLPVRADHALQNFEKLLWHYDEPFADSSFVPSFVLARALSSRFRVVLNGDGGDEAFGGYRHYEYIGVKQTLKAAAATAGLRDGKGSSRSGLYLQSKALFDRAARQQILGSLIDRSEPWSFDELLQNHYAAPLHVDALKRALWMDRHLHLANGLNYKTDIAFAAHGMESRGPFLDHRLMEYTYQLPSEQFVRGAAKKLLFRNAYRKDLPSVVLSRKKLGFGAPVKEWLEGPLLEFVRDTLPSPLLSTGGIRSVSGQRLWTLLIFAAWARQWRAEW